MIGRLQPSARTQPGIPAGRLPLPTPAAWRLAFAAGATLLLAGCVNPDSHILVASTAVGPLPVQMRTDMSHRFIAFYGVRQQHAPPFLDVANTNFFTLRSWIDRDTGEITHQIYVSDSYRGAKKGWNAAREGDEDALRFIPISQDEISCVEQCSYAEDFAANLPDAMLRARPEGITIIFSSETGDEKTIRISPDRIAAQLAIVDGQHATLDSEGWQPPAGTVQLGEPTVTP